MDPYVRGLLERGMNHNYVKVKQTEFVRGGDVQDAKPDPAGARVSAVSDDLHRGAVGYLHGISATTRPSRSTAAAGTR